MRRALFLAERGRGRTTPNPIVGAVIVSPDGVVVGQGAHLQAGGPHAEVAAIEAAGEAARGATLYCTLEPCSHTGRTGPCAVRVAEAGISRVVVAVADPNPRVSGQGIAYMREHGIDVVTGVAEGEARAQHAPFFTWVTEHRPFVIVKAAATLDGYVGRPTDRVKLTGPVADRYFHRQRAEVDAIAIDSLHWGGIQSVNDRFGNRVGSFSVASESGFDFSRAFSTDGGPSGVPEPASMALVLAAWAAGRSLGRRR